MGKKQHEIAKAIKKDNPKDIDYAYKVYGVGTKTTIIVNSVEYDQLEYAAHHESPASIYHLVNQYSFNITEKAMNLALEGTLGKLSKEIIIFLLRNSDDIKNFTQKAIDFYYKNDNYEELLYITERLDLSYDYFQLKALAFPKHQYELEKNGAKYSVFDYLHALLKIGSFEHDFFIKHVSKTNVGNYRGNGGNVIHVLRNLYENNKKLYTKFYFMEAAAALFQYYDLDPNEVGYDHQPASCYLDYQKDDLLKKYIDNRRCTVHDFVYPIIYQNGCLDYLFSRGLPKDEKIQGMSLFQYALKKEKYYSVATLYNKVPDATSFHNGQHIIELAHLKKDRCGIVKMFDIGLGYCYEEYTKIKKSVLFEAFCYLQYKSEFPTVNNYGCILYDFIINYNGKCQIIISEVIRNMAENKINLTNYDDKFKFIETYFKFPKISDILPLNYLINHGASLKYGNPLHFLIENWKKSGSFGKNLHIILKHGLYTEKIDPSCGMIADIVQHSKDGSLEPVIFMKTLKQINDEVKGFNVQLYDEKIKFFNIWNGREKIKSQENFKFLKKIGASPHNICNLRSFFCFDEMYRSLLLEETLAAFVEHKKGLPRLDNDNYLLLAAGSKSMICKSPKVIEHLINLGVDPKPVENRFIFILIDKFVTNVEIYQALVDNKINIDVMNEKGETPLIYLLKNWGVNDIRYEIADFFLKNGVSKKAKDYKGYTALAVAKIENDKKMVDMVK